MRAVIVTNIKTGKEQTFESVAAAARHCSTNPKSIFNAIKRKKPVCGYTFRYINHIRRIQADVVVAMAESDLNVSECARKLGKCRDTVESQIFDIIDLTGKDPRKFFDMCELYPMAKAVLEEEHEHQG